MSFVKDVFNGITGKTGAKAATDAGKVQADASKYAADISQKQFNQTRQDQMPWLNAGKSALGDLTQYINKSPDFNDKWGGRIEQAYQGGQLTGGLDPNNFQNDPSYQFRKQQGMDGLQSSAAAGGSLLSGAALKSLNEYNSNLASQEYGNAWQRDQTEKQNLFSTLSGNRSQDYSLFSNEDTRQYNQLANMAGVGQQTANDLGAFGAQNAATQGDAAINGANMQANGLIGAAGAKTNGINNLLGIGMKAAGMFI
ncbi:hypothetical protein [Psychrobacter sp. K31L]|uniref:hypothetical protein n=1 Tax=Psychrobacter sp. K31L TaxID=2820758 RepID=UPI001B33BFAB|nr:hypothetical protein [Psychrobacter sp. K31L]MBP3945118.1 hypothetical protein [Psychrobacter sp. K31L]